ncbi:MAG: hypothetical protein A3E80_06080 [Chlamydiae bacterium RIFCSPHIGHO2_12_FULL_49_9]|nr:MAG: hypothetical protein A3E80_06080 [Chlamydiae bacterium RIFCSPHIGHO2_12_FULL_49_9]
MLAIWTKIQKYEQDIQAELQKADPDWNKIKSDLENMRFGIKEILSIANANRIKIPSDPNFLQELASMSTLISSMEGAIGNPQKMASLLQEFGQYMTSIYQDLLQG